MRHITQRTNSDCVPTALSMLLGCDMSSYFSGSSNGVAINELMFVLEEFHVGVVTIQKNLLRSKDPKNNETEEVEYPKYLEVLKRRSGLLLTFKGNGHCVAWDHKSQQVYDPAGPILGLDEALKYELFIAQISYD